MSSIQEMADERDEIFWQLTHTELESTARYGKAVFGLCETHEEADENKRMLLRMIELDREITMRNMERKVRK